MTRSHGLAVSAWLKLRTSVQSLRRLLEFLFFPSSFRKAPLKMICKVPIGEDNPQHQGGVVGVLEEDGGGTEGGMATGTSARVAQEVVVAGVAIMSPLEGVVEEVVR